MLKHYLKRKITISLLIIIVLLIIYFFPTNNFNPPINTSYINVYKEPIFLIDNNNYVAKVNMSIKSKNINERVKEKISILTINSNQQNYLPNNFAAIIPNNTKILDMSINNKIIKINFSKELLNVTSHNEEKMIEAIVFTLTEEKEIDNVMIFVEGNILSTLPNSQKLLPSILNRDIGINKVYEIDNYKNINQTTIYFLGKNIDNYYYIPVTFINNDNRNKIDIIINELKSTPIYQTNLISFLRNDALVLNHEIIENTLNISFNEYIFNDLEKRNITEEVKYSIYLSSIANYPVEVVNYYYNNELITTLP